MNRTSLSLFSHLTLLLLSMSLPIMTVVSVSATLETPVFCSSSVVVPEPGQTFEIDITVTYSPPVVGWALNLTWNPDVLDIVDPFNDITEGDFLEREGTTIFLVKPINHTAGVIREMCCFILFDGNSSGSGILCKITFTTVAAGHSNIDIHWGILFQEYLNVIYPILMDGTVEVGQPSPPVIPATIDINPNALNLRSKGKWITGYIELSEGYAVADINVSTIILNDTIPAELRPKAIGDYDDDGIPDLMVKFDRQAVTDLILQNYQPACRFGTVTLTMTGYLYDGTPFQGSDTIRIIYFGIPWEILMAKILRYETYMQMLYG